MSRTLEDVLRGVDAAGVPPASGGEGVPVKRRREHESEADLERRILKMVGVLQRTPEGKDIFIYKQETGQGYTGNVRFALRQALAPFGAEVQQAVEQVLMRHRIQWGHVGQPDLAGAVGGRYFSSELKKPVSGRLSEEQAAYHAAMRERGAFVSEDRSVEDFLASLERCRQGELE